MQVLIRIQAQTSESSNLVFGIPFFHKYYFFQEEGLGQNRCNEAQRAHVVNLREEEYTFVKIADHTGIPRSTFCNVVKRDMERQESNSATPYTASALRSRRLERLNH